LAAFAHGEVPFDSVVEELRPERDPNRTPLVQALVVLQNTMVQPHEAGGLRITEHDLPRPSARFDLVVEFWPRGDSMDVAIEYNTDLFDAATVARMTGHLLVLLKGIVAGPQRPLAHFPLLTYTELLLQRLLRCHHRVGHGAGSVAGRDRRHGRDARGGRHCRCPARAVPPSQGEFVRVDHRGVLGIDSTVFGGLLVQEVSSTGAVLMIAGAIAVIAVIVTCSPTMRTFPRDERIRTTHDERTAMTWTRKPSTRS
jgi:non-ribosomal peptide synthetase component F